jgi:cullin-associated NEDD8-dissociated protein 1
MLFLGGGADTWNMLVPLGCQVETEYATVRGDIAMLAEQLDHITTTGQTCNTFGVHPQLSYLTQLYNEGTLAFVANMGPLVEPTSVLGFRFGTAQRCPGLFSHSDQQNAAKTMKCQTVGTAPRGLAGRMADALSIQGYRAEAFSMHGTSVWPQGFNQSVSIIDPWNGAVRLNHLASLGSTIDGITQNLHSNVYSEEYVLQLRKAVDTSDTLGGFLDAVTLHNVNYHTGTGLSRELHQVARMIATRADRKVEREFYYVELGGFDHHSNVLEALAEKFGEVNRAVEDFIVEIKAEGIYNNIVLTMQSEFGRSLTSNGAGTDHAWAGNYFILGGSVNGGRVYNDYPDSLVEGNPMDVGRARQIPKYPFDSMMAPVAEWMGVDLTTHASVLPNLVNFNSSFIIDRQVLFA